MQTKVETEKKYYCIEPERLIKMAEMEGFKEKSKKTEIDEYFTDINSKFIADRTCLRIRRTSNDSMEITFKGKSSSFTSKYCKLENNILMESSRYNDFVNLFSSLGYYSYVEVEKERLVYELIKNGYKYSIMLDKLPEIGGFVEFEIISDQNNSNRVDLSNLLEKFVSKFNALNLKEATKPYRDIVAGHIFNSLVPDNATDIYIDIDEEISAYEKDFFKRYKSKISSIYGVNIKWGEYKKRKEMETELEDLINGYFEKLIFDSNTILVMFELLKKLKYNVHFMSKVNALFIKCLFKKIEVECPNIISLKESQPRKVLLNNNINLKSSIIINDKDIKSINSNLLIIINNEKD